MQTAHWVLGVAVAASLAVGAAAARKPPLRWRRTSRPAEEIAAAFNAETGDTMVLSFGATGALYTQITQGAPFKVFLSADNKRPAPR